MFQIADRRTFLGSASGALVGGAAALGDPTRPASIVVSLDLEMCRNFPTWDATHWDYEKGNLNDETKRYALEAARRVKNFGGQIHFFVVGQVFEQRDVDWLKQLLAEGHLIGNHTYDHVNVIARKPAELQYRFSRAPWLIEGQTPTQVIRDNIRLCSAAMETRLGIKPAGFRTPGGFADGLAHRQDVQRMLLDLGFTWVSSKYPSHLPLKPNLQPTRETLDSIVKEQHSAQPFRYPTGLVEAPMSPISDIVAFRGGRWKLDWFLEAVASGVRWALEHGRVYDFLGHPACLYVMDPQFRTIDLIGRLVRDAGSKATWSNLNQVARRVENKQ